MSGGAARWVFLESCLSISVSTTLYSEYSLCLLPLTFFFLFFFVFLFGFGLLGLLFFYIFFFRFTWAPASWAGRLGWFMIFGRGHELQSKGGPSFFYFF